MIKQLKIRNKLIFMILVIALGLTISGFISYILIQNIRVGGKYYNSLIQSKDLIADLLPPPAFIVESYLLAFQELAEKDPIERDRMIQLSQKLQVEYEGIQKRFLYELPEGYLKELLTHKSNELVESFFSIWKKEFLVALEEGKLDKANQVLLGPMSEKFRAHQEVVEEVIALLKDQYLHLKTEATNFYLRARVIAWLSWGVTLFLSGWVAVVLLISLIKRLRFVTHGLESISNQISGTANEQTESTAEQTKEVAGTTRTLDELNASFQTTQALAQESSDRAKHASKMSEEGNIQLKKMVEQLSKHKEKVAQILEHTLRLGQFTRQIHNIASLTSNLTNQTNILALNAAVQAAHVKQYGEGFSVIAGEIRKLGEESKKFLTHIDGLSKDIEQATDATIAIVDEGNVTLQDSLQLAQSTSWVFDSIMNLTNLSVEGAERSTHNIKHQGEALLKIFLTMEELNKVSQSNLKGMQKIKSELSKLNDLSQQLKSDIE